MKFLGALYIFIFLLATQAFGADQSKERWELEGFYGLAFISPSDINNNASNQGTTPKLNFLSSDYYYGGGLGFMISPKFQVIGSFELQDAKNGVTTTSPFSATGAGFELLQNEIWGSLNYFLFHTGKTYGYLGASLGFPTYCHVTSTLASKTEFDADKTLGYRGQLGIGVVFGNHFSLFAEGGYQSLVSGTIKSSTGTILTTANGSNAKMDLSGVRVQGGLAFLF